MKHFIYLWVTLFLGIIGGSISSATSMAPDSGLLPKSDTPITVRPEGKTTYYSLTSRRYLWMLFTNVSVGSLRDKAQECVESDGGDFYMKDPIPDIMLGSWIKGKKSAEGTITFEFPQYLGAQSGSPFSPGGNYYMRACEAMYDNEGEIIGVKPKTNQVVTFKTDANGVITPDSENLVLGLTNENGDEWKGYGLAQFTYSRLPEKVQLPDGAEARDYVLLHEDMQTPGYGTKIKVAVKGKEAYIGGFPGLDNMWAKGTLTGNPIAGMEMTMKCCQFMGIDTISRSIINFHTGSFFTDKMEDQEVQGLRAKESITFNVKGILNREFTIEADSLGFWYSFQGMNAFGNPRIYPQNHDEEVLDVPMNPIWNKITEWNVNLSTRQLSFWLPVRNKDNNKLLQTENLYYNIYLDDSSSPYVYEPDKYNIYDPDNNPPVISGPMKDIPWNFYTPAYFDFIISRNNHVIFLREKDIKRVGVQLICRIGDEERKSEIVYLDVLQTSVQNPFAEDCEVVNTEYYDLLGNKTDHPNRGVVYVCRQTLSDGTVRVNKVIP